MDLKKSLKYIDVFSISAGAMISSGIFILPGLAFARTGPSVFVSYFLAGILGLLGVLSVIELITAMPKAGGDYYFVTRSLGPAAGTVSGFLSWFALSLKSAFAIYGISVIILRYLGISHTDPNFYLWLHQLSAVITLAFVVVNLVGVKEAAKLEVILVVGLISLMAFYVITGISKINISAFEPFNIKYFTNNGSLTSEPGSFFDIITTAGFVFISFGGLLKVASISEEVTNPSKNLPRGMVSSLAVVVVLYVLMLVVTVGLLSPEQLINSETPIADAAFKTLGKVGEYAISIAAMLAFITTANAGIMSASRYPMALARDGLAPQFISKVSKGGTPYISIIVTGVFIALSLLLPLKILVKVASTVILLSYILGNLAVIILRESKVQNYRPTFKIPFYPVLPIICILIFSGLIVNMSLEEGGLSWFLTSASIFVVSILFYIIYGRKHNHEYALLHILARVTNKKLTSRNLEEELKQVIRHRDDVVKDEIDYIIEDAYFGDFKKAQTKQQFFEKIAPTVAEEISLSQDDVVKFLIEREEQSSTVLTPLLAVPHIILEGTDIFKIFVFRNKEGIDFENGNDKIKAVFIIIGTKDKRNLHLKALAAVAQIMQHDDFTNLWQKAQTIHQLKDVVLLGKRKR